MSEKQHVIIAKTDNFTVKVPNLPHITRDEGGHIFVETNNERENRWEFNERESMEQAWLTQLAAEAYWSVMKDELSLYKLNLQDNGNWAFIDDRKALFHVHIYGRSEREKDDDTSQSYGQALSFPWRDTGYYDDFAPLSEKDVREIAAEMEMLSKLDRYKWERMDADVCAFDAVGAR